MAGMETGSRSTDPGVVFVLGAGFSRAISEAMPLTDELGTAALARLRKELPPRLALKRLPEGMNFEAWLSELASNQPYLSDGENAQNQAAFLMFSQAIADILGDDVKEVLSAPYPEWLLILTSAWHHTRATVITFNYDPLVECFVQTPTRILGDPNRSGQVWHGVSWTELSGGLPGWAAGNARLASTRVDTFRLLKLHGSLNWYWRAGDESGVSVARRPLPGHFGQPEPYTDEDRRRDVPGRTPFVVPPSASKSRYYANPITKEMWSQAFERLKSAEEIYIVGYSLPVTDTTFSNMLRSSLQARAAETFIADYAPEPVRLRLLDLGLNRDRIRIVGEGRNAVASLVETWAASLSRDVLQAVLGHEEGDLHVVLAWGDSAAYSPLDNLKIAGEQVEAGFSRVYNSFSLATGINSQPSLNLREIQGILSELVVGATPAFVARDIARQERGWIVAMNEASVQTGQGDGRWLLLQVAATPPPPSE